MTTLLLFGLLCSLFLHFLTSLIKRILWLKCFSTEKRQAEDLAGEQGL